MGICSVWFYSVVKAEYYQEQISLNSNHQFWKKANPPKGGDAKPLDLRLTGAKTARLPGK